MKENLYYFFVDGGCGYFFNWNTVDLQCCVTFCYELSYTYIYFLEKGKATHSIMLAWRIPRTRWSWQATVHGVTKSRIQLKRLEYSAHVHRYFHSFCVIFNFFFLLFSSQKFYTYRSVLRIVLQWTSICLSYWFTTCKCFACFSTICICISLFLFWLNLLRIVGLMTLHS